MWYIIALFFMIMALNKLLAGAYFSFGVLLLFAWFAIYLSRSGIDIIY